VTIRRYAYGLAAAAALTGGSILYYMTTDPGPYVTADDVAELLEAVNERWAALATDRHTGTSNDWSFTVFTNLPNQPVAEQLHLVMSNTVLLAPHYVEEVSNGVPIMFTPPRLFQLAGVGPADGTQALFTVGYQTNGAPIYSNAPTMFVSTGLLWQCHRLLAKMTTTKRDSQWYPGPEWLWLPPNNQWLHDTGTVFEVESYDDPDWWTNLPAYPVYQQIGAAPLAPAVLDASRVDLQTTGYAGVGRPFDQVRFGLIQTPGSVSVPPRAEREDQGDFDPFLYRPYTTTEQFEDAWRVDASGGVSIASMASGCSVVVSIPWATSGSWVNVSGSGGAVTTLVDHVQTTTVSLAFSGVSTNWGGHAIADDVKYRLSDFLDVSAEQADPWLELYADYSGYPDVRKWRWNSSLGGRVESGFRHPAILIWTFTRCRP
jgi:hypothetical protein